MPRRSGPSSHKRAVFKHLSVAALKTGSLERQAADRVVENEEFQHERNSTPSGNESGIE